MPPTSQGLCAGTTPRPRGARTRSPAPTPLDYFGRTRAARRQTWSGDLEVVFERFRVVRPAEVADRLSAPGW